MSAIALLIIVISFFYACLMVSLALGWCMLKPFQACENGSEKLIAFVSIIIAVRNEEKNIPVCLHNLLQQEYPSEYFEIIVIDDHSTDGTAREIKKVANKTNVIKLISLAEKRNSSEGKKAAIAAGIEQAIGSLIISTDADCRFTTQWLRTIAAYNNNYKPAMISAPVVFQSQSSIAGKFMELEFISLVASGAGALGLKKPLMCNGANLIFQRTVFNNLNAFVSNKQWASGDDMFLMHEIKKKHGSEAIHFLKSEHAIVETHAPGSLREFIHQRIRWGSKTKAYPGTFTAFAAVLVFLNALMLISGTILLISHLTLIIPVVVGWVLKFLSDWFLLYPATIFFKRRKLLVWFVPFGFVHNIYIVVAGIMGLFSGFRWKDRGY